MLSDLHMPRWIYFILLVYAHFFNEIEILPIIKVIRNNLVFYDQ